MPGKHRNSKGLLLRGHISQSEHPAQEEKIASIGDVNKMSMKELKRRICTEGPEGCAACESSCAYGREYVKREADAHGR